jgi:hypothetical protein
MPSLTHNIRLSRLNFTGTNTLAYSSIVSLTKKKSFNDIWTAEQNGIAAKSDGVGPF